MPHIQQLDPHVADLIAAGEVVERPASVVKELVENAIDAGAGAVTVEIARGGMALIRVTDDGCGIPRDQAPTAFLRHATSKLRVARDLEAIQTLGFRGEALAAIAAVSRVDLLTRTADAPMGCALSLEGGVPGPVEDAGCPPGTTLVVRDLFFNTPARLKFMKKDSAEGAAVFAAVQRQALSHPEVSVKFIRDGRQELLTPGDGQLRSAVYCVLGRELALGMREVSAAGEEVSVRGFVSLPACCRGSRGSQYFFVNGRPIRSAMLAAALENAYANQKMVGRFPGCVLHLTLRPNAVDVNVHPAKTEVKFGSERKVFDAVYYAVRSALEADRSRPSALEPDRPGTQDTVTPNQLTLSQDRPAPARAALAAEAARAAARGALAGGVGEHRPGVRPAAGGLGTSRPGSLPGGGGRPLSRETPVPGGNGAAADSGAAFPGGTREHPGPGGLTLSDSAAALRDGGVTLPGGAALRGKDSAEGAAGFAPGGTKSSGGAARTEGSSMVLPGGAVWAGDAPAGGASPRGSTPSPGAEDPEVPASGPQTPAWRLIGEAFRTYVIVELEDRVLLIDKHAAHERLNFDAMRAEGYRPMVQLLLAPVTVTPPAEEGAALAEQLPLLRRFGFDMEEFGGGSFLVRAVPSDLDFGDIPGALDELAQRLLVTGTADPDAARDELLHTMACKAAIKAGQRNDPAELKVLVDAVASGRVKYCPHGRPVAVELTRGQLEKRFKRA